MFKNIKYIIQTEDKLFDIYILLFEPTYKYILDICYKSIDTIVQCVSDNKLSYVSNIKDNTSDTNEALYILFFLQINMLIIELHTNNILFYNRKC